LQEVPEVALFPADVRILASSKTTKGEMSMKRFVIALGLTCVLASSSFAGDVPSVGITSTGPDSGQPSSTAPGEIPTGGSSYEITQTAIDLIQTFIGVGV
jgi:hypothetical protein